MRLPIFLIFWFSLIYADNFKFTVTLKEQPSESNENGQKYLPISSQLTCGDKNCDYSVTITNFQTDFFRVLVNNKECTTSCFGNFLRRQTVNVTVHKTTGEYLKLFDFEYVDTPKIVVLGCEKGFYNDKKCTRLTEYSNNLDDGSYFYDEVCVCTENAQQAFCDWTTPGGVCTVGEEKWWNTLGSSTTSTQKTTEPSVISTTIWSDINVSLNETGLNPAVYSYVIVSAYMNCTGDLCAFTSTVTNYNPEYYTVYVGDNECNSHCPGTLLQDHSVPVTIKRSGKQLNLLTYQWTKDYKGITVLGCMSGLILTGTCVRSMKDPQVNLVSLHDVVCSCMGDQTKCDDNTQIGVCLGGTPNWWIDDPEYSSSTYPTSLSTVTFPPRDPNSFDLQFLLFEGESDGSHPDNDKNITVTAGMNCSTVACQYTVTSVQSFIGYYTVLVNGKECPVNTCTNTFPKGTSIPVTVVRLSEKLDLFGLQFFDEPNVEVLGCPHGMLDYGYCRKTGGYYDDTIQKDDGLCVCQNSEMRCDGTTPIGSCSNSYGQPIWWKPLHETSTVPSTTTVTPFKISFDIGLFETVDKGTQRISVHGDLSCSEYLCTFKITVTNQNPGYFLVFLAGGNDCQESCESTFQPDESVPVYIYKTGQFLEFFVMKFEEVLVLNCTSGWLEPEQCVMVINGNDEVCSCEGVNDQCQGQQESAKCASGTPTWWKPDPKYTTIPLPSTVPSTSVSTTTSTTSPQTGTTVTVTLSESPKTEPGVQKTLTVEASMNCMRDACQWDANIGSTDATYYKVMMDGKECKNPCFGSISHGEPSKVLQVHRQDQHLDFIEFQFIDSPKMLIMGCEKVIEDTPSAIVDTVCLHIFETDFAGPNTFFDDVCICNGYGQDCDSHTKVGKCGIGKFAWWINDNSTPVPTIATTTTKTTATTQTTTSTKTTVPTNQFTFDISLSEGRDNKKNQLSISSGMACSAEKCEYNIKVDNSAQAYFKVFVGKTPCQNTKCSGSFLKSNSVNVTVYRDTQVLDLFDFEYMDTPRIVVLGCEDGLTEYGNCVQMVKAIKVGSKDYVDEVCSCRSSELDCKVGKSGVCRRGATSWWKDVDATSTTKTTQTTKTTTTPTPTTTSNAMPSLQDLSNGGVGLNNVTQVLNDTNHYSKQGEYLNHTQIFEITKILHNSANLPGISSENAVQILQNMDQCLDAQRREIRNGQSKDYRLLNVLMPMVKNTKDKIIQYLHGRNLGFNAKKVNCQTENHTDDGMIYFGPDKGYAILNDTNKLSATTENSIIVPLGSVCEDQEVSHVFFTIFRGQKLFSGKQKYRTWGEQIMEDDDEENSMEKISNRYKRDTNGSDSISQVPAPSKCSRQISVPQVPVMSATLMAGDSVIRAFSMARMISMNGAARAPPIAKLQFNVGKIPKPLHGDNIVSWFDTTGQEWSLNEQCKIQSDSNGLISANCEHLTDFTVLIYGQLDAEYVCSWPLIIIGYSVNGASIVCLLLLIVIGLMFYLRYDLIHRILSYIRGQAQTSGDVINLAYYCIFFIFFILSLFFMDQSTNGEGPTTTSTYCVVIAAVSYFSLISAIIMSMLIGIRMICHFFSPKLRAFFSVMTSPPAALSIGLIIPFTFTMVLAIFDTQFFERNDSFCWVRPDYIVYAVVVPVVLPIINGLICSIFAIYKMFFQAKRGMGSREATHYDAEFWSKVVGLLIMQVAMGLPWGIEFILIGVSGPSPWNYIFVILLGTQGIDLFLIFLYRRQRLVNESRKWSAREEKLQRKRHFTGYADDES